MHHEKNNVTQMRVRMGHFAVSVSDGVGEDIDGARDQHEQD